MEKHASTSNPTRKRRWRGLALAPLAALVVSTFAATAHAENMAAKFIRIDPEPSTDEKKGTPVVNMIVELATANPITSFEEGCNVGGSGKKATRDAYACMSGKIESQGYVKQFEFPKENAHVVSIVGGEPRPMEIVDANPLKDVEAANAGVAWEILVDASSSIGTRWGSMQDVADSIIKAMGPHDAVQIKIMDDKGVRAKTKWLAAGSKGKASTTLRSVTSTYKSTAQVDSLINRVEKETVDGFQALFKDGVEGADEDVMPLIQAVVILSDGGDSSAAGFAGGAEAKMAHDKLVKGEMGIGDIKLPIPVISIWFPTDEWTGLLAETRRNNEYQWMSNMATPEVGGYFDVVLAGETKGAKIAKQVRNRFDNMYYVESKASCLDTSGEQKFKLVFEDTKSKIIPDTWDKVPIAFNFTKWLLDVDKKKTEEAASKAPLKPGETFNVFGDFCWGSNTGAAEAYFVTEADAAEVKKAAADKTGKAAKALLQNLAAKGQKAETVSASPLEAKFKVPNTPALFDNKPDQFSLNVVILDTKALRVSARDQAGLLVLRAQKAPINKLLIVGAIGGGVVLILLIAILARSGGGGGGRAKRRAGAPPAPGPTPGQPPGPPPGPGYAPGGSTPSGPNFGAGPASPAFSPPPQAPATAFAPPATAFAPPQPPATAFAPPQTAFAPPATAFAPPQTAFAPPQTAFAPPQAAPAFPPAQQPAPAFPPAQPAPTAYAPPQPPAFPPAQPAPLPIPQLTPKIGSFEPGAAVATLMPQNNPPPVAPQGLHAAHKGATSFPTTCPNPSCRRQVLVPPGGTAQCAFCGTLVDSSGSAQAPLPPPANFGLTGAASESAAALAIAAAGPPTAQPIGGGTVALQSPAGIGELRAVTLTGQNGTFRVLAGIESRAGRDGTMCSIHLNDPRVSGVHATLKVERGALLVRDDKSHNGTFVNGNRIAPATWTPVPGGSQLRFGPIEFMVRHES